MLQGIAHGAFSTPVIASLAQQDQAAGAMALLLMLAGLIVAFLLAMIIVRLTRRSTVSSRPRKKSGTEGRVDAWSEAGRRLEVPPEDATDAPPDRSA